MFFRGLYIENIFCFSLIFVFLCFDKGILELLGPEGLVIGICNVFNNKIFVFECLSFFFFKFNGFFPLFIGFFQFMACVIY